MIIVDTPTRKKEEPPTYKEKIFWQRFEEIEKQSFDGVVQSQKLKDSLVASNIFDIGEAVSMIETMVDRGGLEVVEHGYYRRVKPMVKHVREETTNEHNNNLAKMLLLQCMFGSGEGVTILPPRVHYFFHENY